MRQTPVPALKEQIASIVGVPVENQRLICRGKVLKDDQLLGSYSILISHTDKERPLRRAMSVVNSPGQLGPHRKKPLCSRWSLLELVLSFAYLAIGNFILFLVALNLDWV